MPLITKDSIKETLADAIGADGIEQSRRLGAAAVELLYQTGQAILRGGSGVIVESAPWREFQGQLAPLLAVGSPRLIRCHARVEVMLDRYRRRERHPVHFDRGHDSHLERVITEGRYDLALDVPTIDVDTTDGYRPSLEEVVDFARVNRRNERATTRPPTVHMIHGFLCSGKTRFAKELEGQIGAVRLASDDWTIAASGDWEHLDRDLYDRVRAQLERHWIDLARRGLDVILDFGFWSRAERDAARRAAADIGASARLYWLTCPESIARERCVQRNSESVADYYFADGAYDTLLERFEPLGEDEERMVIASG